MSKHVVDESAYCGMTLIERLTAEVNATLLSDLPVSLLAPGTYTIFLMATPSGSPSSFDLWETTFKLP